MSNVSAPRAIAKSRVAKLERNVALSLCESIGTVRSLTVYLLLKNFEDQQYVDLKISANDYSDAKKFADDYLVTSLLQKSPRLSLIVDRKEVAIQGFRAAELVCSDSNLRIENAFKTGIFPSPDVGRSVLKAQSVISRILGPLTRSKLSFAESKMRFGPGSTTSLSGCVTQGKKFSGRRVTCTPRVLPFRMCLPALWQETCKDLVLRASSKVRTVPKNAKTDRTICIESDLNIYVQLGVGALIRDRLRAFGLDLSSQIPNQELARQGSISDDLCTMDLSSASDTICREAVWNLIPYEWADLLHFCRTDKYELDGKEIEFHKWSSMGNGYTFELETLIFLGVLHGCREELEIEDDRVIAYGDDLIFPSSMSDLVSRTLDFLGFKVNSLKTFGKGVFRESCGADWFEGVNVRPIFLRSEHHDFETICYTYANSIRRWARDRNSLGSCDVRCLDAWKLCFNACATRHAHRIPDNFGDVGFISNWDEATPYSRVDGRQWGGFSFSLRRIPSRVRLIDSLGAYVSTLSGNQSDFSQGREALRGIFEVAVTKRGYSLEWPNLGPWH